MKIAIIVLSGLVIFVFGGLLGLLITISTNQPQPPPAAIIEISSEEQELASELEELQMLFQDLQSQLNAQQAETAETAVPSISGQAAREAALEHIGGQGIIQETLLFEENGILLFEIEIINENLRHMVYINAQNGTVVRSEFFNVN